VHPKVEREIIKTKARKTRQTLELNLWFPKQLEELKRLNFQLQIKTNKIKIGVIINRKLSLIILF
jgi:hypothetical protein